MCLMAVVCSGLIEILQQTFLDIQPRTKNSKQYSTIFRKACPPQKVSKWQIGAIIRGLHSKGNILNVVRV